VRVSAPLIAVPEAEEKREPPGGIMGSPPGGST